MKIVVLVKQVPDTDNVRIDPETGTMVREGLDAVMNLFDMYALEIALRLRDEHGGKVIAVSMGPPNTESVLRDAIAMGANRAILLTDRNFAGADTLATSVVIAEAIERFVPDFDLIVAGEKATDGETGQVGPEVGTLLKIPVLSYVSRIVESSKTELVVERSVEDGIERWRVKLPALLTVSRSVARPRIPTLKGMKRAMGEKVERYGLGDLKLSRSEVGLRGSPTRVVKVYNVKVTRKGEIFEGEEVERGIEKVVEVLRGFLG